MRRRGADKVEKVVRADTCPGEALNVSGLLSFTANKPLRNQALAQSGQVVRNVVRMCPETRRTDNTPPLGGVLSAGRTQCMGRCMGRGLS